MRLMGATDKASRTRAGLSRAVSFLDDWASLARLAAELLGINLDRLLKFQIPAHAVSENLSADEVSFLRDLVSPGPIYQIDGEYVANRLSRISNDLEFAAAADDAHHVLALNLGPNSGLSRAVREASDLTIEMNDLPAQREFVGADLDDSTRVLAVAQGDTFRMVIRGSQLAYHLRQFAVSRSATPTWEFAACDNASLADQWGGKILASRPLVPTSVTLMPFAEAFERTPKLRGRVFNWELIRSSLERAVPSRPSREMRAYQGLVLLHAMELSLASADVFPVSVDVQRRSATTSEEDSGRLRVLPDPDRDLLSTTLGLRPLDERLRELVEREAVSEEEGWLLADSQTLGRRTATDVEMQFESLRKQDSETVLEFRVTSQGLDVQTGDRWKP